MKKTVLSIILISTIGLAGCGTKELETKNSEQAATIEMMQKDHAEEVEKLNATIESLSQEQASMAKMEVGETVTLSGTIVIGEDLEPGVYDITLPGSEDVALSIFENQKAVDESVYSHEWLFPKSEENEKKVDDSLVGYSLKKGNVIELSKNLNFTKVR